MAVSIAARDGASPTGLDGSVQQGVASAADRQGWPDTEAVAHATASSEDNPEGARRSVASAADRQRWPDTEAVAYATASSEDNPEGARRSVASAAARQRWPQTVMRRVRNFFERERIEGAFAITGGVLEPLPDAPYIAISGSAWHDGVFPRDALAGDMPEGGATAPTGPEDSPEGSRMGIATDATAAMAGRDETFSGTVWGLYPPDDFLALCEQIGEYDAKNPIGAPQSESFGAYSYTRGAVSAAGGGWEAAFAGQLLPYRRMYTEVDV